MSVPEITVVDYGLGNLLSVSQAIAQVGAYPVITREPDILLSAERIVLPGVGAFAVAMGHLTDLGLGEALISSASRGTPVLGICLGMQMLFDYSLEFGRSEGLGLIPGKVVQVVESPNNAAALRTTHIGWRELARTPGSENHKIFHQFDFDDSLYFVHSYSVQAMDPRHTLATVDYGGREVTAVVAADSVVGVQFHPEKSGSAGLKILENFLAI